MKFFFCMLLFLLFASNMYSFPGKGSGTAEDPYQITNVYELQDYKSDKDAYYILMNDIDASETKTWNLGDHDNDPDTPEAAKGFIPADFYGTFDGNGYLIQDLFINLPKDCYLGLFQRLLGSEVKIYNLGIVDCDITGDYYVGALCGLMETYGNSVVYRCFATGQILSMTTTDMSGIHVGGFCGLCAGQIVDCYSECLVDSKSKNNYYVASFCTGWSVENCYTIGSVTAQGMCSPFGIINEFANTNCYWDIETTGIPSGDSNFKREKGYLTTAMKSQKIYVGFDFDNIWYIDEGKDYPKLRVFDRSNSSNNESMSFEVKNFDLEIVNNPVYEKININCYLPYSSFVTIILYNDLGKEIKELAKSKLFSTGFNNISIDIPGIRTGVYFISCSYQNSIISKKIIIIQ